MVSPGEVLSLGISGCVSMWVLYIGVGRHISITFVFVTVCYFWIHNSIARIWKERCRLSTCIYTYFRMDECV